MRLSLVERNIIGSKNKETKGVKEDESVALASKGKTKKGPSQGKGHGEEKRRRRIYRRLNALDAVIFVTTIPTSQEKEGEVREGINFAS